MASSPAGAASDRPRSPHRVKEPPEFGELRQPCWIPLKIAPARKRPRMGRIPTILNDGSKPPEIFDMPFEGVCHPLARLIWTNTSQCWFPDRPLSY
jgi:hypothetical protein